MMSRKFAYVVILNFFAAAVAQEPAVQPPGKAPVSQAIEEKSQGDGPELNGWCPAAYLLQGSAKQGDAQFKTVYQGNLYYCSSAEAQKAFEADPEKYLPQYGGWCTTSLQGFGNRIIGDPKVYDVVNGKVYLFSQERARNSFLGDAGDHITRADQRWAEPELGGWCPVSFSAGQPVKGEARYSSVFHALHYFLSSAEAKKAFDADPGKYLPYEIFCATTVATKNSRTEVDPQFYTAVNGRTYFFSTGAAKAEFDKDPAGMIAKGDANWPTLKRPTKIIRKHKYE